MEAGKQDPPYRCLRDHRLDPADFKSWLSAIQTRVTSKYGSVIVKAGRGNQGPHPGVAYIPMGPWANMVINPNTYSTGMPTFKGTPVEVEIAKNEPVFSSLELVRKGCRGELA